ncbi:secretion protein [Flavobacterium magnum]|uniref:Secretion protein n=1 Tax=Flavobacterium magnum TaxID=2162713 RepID=A0A2S0RDJ2_9FLAO|nr:T9SS type A sorting domain-containing protein [Flavobacterium magnum]AWA29746.1 secretion protein [Flavobacterium magnum]
MKQFTSIILLLVSITASAQLYVAPNYYLYVRNEVLFVKQDISLQSNGNVFLRNEAQLLQGTAGSSTNKGTGKLSVYQEGTSDNFEYNYWCSPVGIATNTAGNENFGITMLGRPVTAISSTPAVMISNDSDGVANPLAISTYWIYKYLPAVSSAWIPVGSATSIGPGEGFTMKGTAGTDNNVVEGNGIPNNPGGLGAQRYDFSGKPNDGNITVTVTNGKFTLTGNPYPSALHVNAFLLDAGNSACTGIAYYWEQDKTLNTHNVGQYRGGYGTYAPVSLASSGIYVPATFNTYNADGTLNTTGTSSGQTYPRKYAPIGQGFLVQGNSNATVTLKNTQRVYYKESGSLSDFERMAVSDSLAGQPVSHLKLNAMLDNGFSRQLALAFPPDATDGADRGIDAPLAAALPDDAYFLIDNNPYAIDGVAFDVNKRINIGVTSTHDGTVTFYIPETVDFPDGQPVYIYDALDDSYHDILSDFYEASLSSGDYHNRFQVTFAADNLGTAGNVPDKALLVRQDNQARVLRILNPNRVAFDAVTVFDMSGRAVSSAQASQTTMTEIPTTTLSSGVYIVRITEAGQWVKTQKVLISN